MTAPTRAYRPKGVRPFADMRQATNNTECPSFSSDRQEPPIGLSQAFIAALNALAFTRFNR